jgi:hypothetical protein
MLAANSDAVRRSLSKGHLNRAPGAQAIQLLSQPTKERSQQSEIWFLAKADFTPGATK